MHDITRDLLLKQAEREEREAARLSAEANELLDRAAEMDAQASACRRAAEALRRDASGPRTFDVRGLGVIPALGEIGRFVYGARSLR